MFGIFLEEKRKWKFVELSTIVNALCPHGTIPFPQSLEVKIDPVFHKMEGRMAFYASKGFPGKW